MLTKEQRVLLENVLESLNRLYDGECTVADVCALLLATSKALIGTPYCDMLCQPLPALQELAGERLHPPIKRDRGLILTDDLRGQVAEALHQDALDNPKGRHHKN